MARGNGGQGTDAPLSWLDHVRLRSLQKHLHSRDHGVRVAAHKAMQRILHKTRGFKRKLADRVLKPAVRKVTPKSLHRVLGAAPAPARTKARKQAAPDPATPWRGYTPPSGRTLTKADLKERARAMKAGSRQGPRQPARQPDLLRSAGLVPPARTPQVPSQGKTTAHRERTQAPAMEPEHERLSRHERWDREAALARAPQAPARVSGQPSPAPARAWTPAPVKSAPLPHETVRTQGKPRWSGLRRRTA